MLSRSMKLLPLLAIVLLGTACDGKISLNFYEARPVRTARVYSAGHICSLDCHDHYWNGTRLIVISGRHRHNSDCGHHFYDGHWIMSSKVKKTRKPRVVHSSKVVTVGKHRHGPSCGCVFDRRAKTWKVLRNGHVHGPGCGHVRVGGKWSIHH